MKLKEAIEKMGNAIVTSQSSEEIAHENADDILCAVIKAMGTDGEEIVRRYHLINKWYA